MDLAGKPADGPAFKVVVTVRPLAMIVQPLLGADASVVTLLPPGVDAHAYEPRPSDAAALQGAQLLLWVSDDLDGWATGLGDGLQVQVLELLPEDLRRVAEERTAGAEAAADHAGHDHSHSHGAVDPHFWSDPAAVAALMSPLAELLAGIDPDHADAYAERAAAAEQELQELAAWGQAQLSGARGKAVVQMHPSLNYLLARYGIRSVGAVEEAPGREPSPRDLADLVTAARAQQAVCVITEPQLSAKAARTLADEAGLALVELDPEAGASRDYGSYGEWFKWNVEQLAATLK